MVTDSIVYAYGRFFGPAGYVKTIDKGKSWTFSSLDTVALGLIDGHFFNKDTGFLTGMAPNHKAMILSTVNGGATWPIAYISNRADSDRVWKIYFPSRNIGYASIQYGESTWHPFNTWFLKTIDGGKTWTEKPFFANYNEEGIGFINDNTGWIGGDEQIGTYKTTDGGDTWYNDETFGVLTPPYTSSTGGFEMNRFRSFGDTLMYASGNTIYKLIRNTEGIRELHTGGLQLGNYPNPFKETTTITYDLPAGADNMYLRVMNVLGEEVYTTSLANKIQGTNQFILNEQLPPGAYYYTIGNDKLRRTAKMMIIK